MELLIEGARKLSVKQTIRCDIGISNLDQTPLAYSIPWMGLEKNLCLHVSRAAISGAVYSLTSTF